MLVTQVPVANENRVRVPGQLRQPPLPAWRGESRCCCCYCRRCHANCVACPRAGHGGEGVWPGQGVHCWCPSCVSLVCAPTCGPDGCTSATHAGQLGRWGWRCWCRARRCGHDCAPSLHGGRGCEQASQAAARAQERPREEDGERQGRGGVFRVESKANPNLSLHVGSYGNRRAMLLLVARRHVLHRAFQLVHVVAFLVLLPRLHVQHRTLVLAGLAVERQPHVHSR